MKATKNAYLAKLTEQIQMRSVKVGKNIEGSTPPSVFIGRWSYPKVYAGPMMVGEAGDTSIMDSPESWIGQNKQQEDIINYRMNLVRGKQLTVKLLLEKHPQDQCLQKTVLHTVQVQLLKNLI